MPQCLVRLVAIFLLPSLFLGPAEAAGNLIFTQQAVNPPPLWEGQPHENAAYVVREEAKEDLHPAARDLMGMWIGFSDIAYMGGKGRTAPRAPDIFGIRPEVVAPMLGKDYSEELFQIRVCNLIRQGMPQFERFITSRMILIPGAILAVNGAPAHGPMTLGPTDTVEIIYKPDTARIDLHRFLLKRWAEKHVGEQRDELLEELAYRFLLEKVFVALVLANAYIKTGDTKPKDPNALDERIATKLRFFGMDTPQQIARLSLGDWINEMGYHPVSIEKVVRFLKRNGESMSQVSIRKAFEIGSLRLPLGDINVLLKEGIETIEQFRSWIKQPQGVLLARLKLYMPDMGRAKTPQSARYMLSRMQEAGRKIIAILAVIFITHGVTAYRAPQALPTAA